MKEDYVSFETAKLLKDKGFGWGCYKVYNKEGVVSISTTIEEVPTNYKNIEYYFLCPTQQMTLRWLREEHNIHIETHYLHKSKDYGYAINNISNGGIMCVNGFDSYENAVESAIIECLTNLL